MRSLLAVAAELRQLNERFEREGCERVDLLVVPIPAGSSQPKIDMAIARACVARGTTRERVELVVLVEHLHDPV
jgi:hypothetical protein